MSFIGIQDWFLSRECLDLNCQIQSHHTQGRRYMVDVKNDYSKLPDVIQPGEYRLNSSSYTIIDGVKRYLFLLQTNVEVRTKIIKKSGK